MVGTEGIEQGIKQGIGESIEQGIKQSSVDALKATSKGTLENLFGRKIPKSYLNSTGDALTDSGAKKFLRTGIRGIVREGGEEGPANALQAVKQALGVPGDEAAQIVVGNLGVRLTRANADEAVMAALKSNKKTLSEIICSSPANIKLFIRSVYDNAIRLGKNPRQALKQAKDVSESIAFKRASLILGVPVAAIFVLGAGWSIYNIGSDLLNRSGESEPSQAEDPIDDPPGSVIGQSIVGLSAIGIGGLGLLAVLTMGGNKEKSAVAASEYD